MNLRRIMCIYLACTLCMLSIMLVCPMMAKASGKTYFSGATPTTYANGSDGLRDALYAIKNFDASSLSGIYIGFHDLQVRVAEFLSISSPTQAEIDNVIVRVSPFIEWAEGVCTSDDGSSVMQFCLKKMGAFVNDFEEWLTDQEFNPSRFIRYLSGLLQIGVTSPESSGTFDVTIMIPSVLMDAIHEAVQSTIDDQSNDFFILIDTISFDEYCDWFDDQQYYDQNDNLGGGSTVAKQRVQDIYDSFWNNDYPYFFKFSTVSSGGKTYPQDIAAYSTNIELYSEGGNAFRPVHSPGNDEYSKMKSYSSNYSSFWTGTGSGVYFNDYETGIGSAWHNQVVTVDGRIIKIYKSLSIYNQLHDWSNGCPYSVLTSDSFNSYDSVDDHSVTVSTQTVTSTNISNDYSSVVSSVISGNDYSSTSISQTINNYYGTYEPSLPSYGPSGGSDNGNGSGSGGSHGTIFDLLDGIGDFLGGAFDIVTGLVSLLGKVVEGIGSIFSLFTNIIDSVASVGDDFGDFLGAHMGFLPSDAISIIVAGIGAMVTIAVIKFLRG